MPKLVPLAAFVRAQLEGLADPAKVAPMAAYMKTDMPFHGVPKPACVPIYRAFKKQFAPTTWKEYDAGVRALWELDYREEKYAAIEYARLFPTWVTSQSMKLYERLVREGAWWDLVDPIATHLVGKVVLDEREAVRLTLEKWIEHKDMWLRRTAILAQNRHKKQTDEAQLFDFCLRRASETEFFIRKAIGWALREYSYAAPSRVKQFLEEHQTELSGLSYREGAKNLYRTGAMERPA